MAKRTGETRGSDEAEGPSFEEDLKRLEEIVRSLEAGDMPLEKSLALYEEGLTLSKRCGQRLDGAEARLQSLLEKDGGTEKVDLDLLNK
jgi:exodeoxyribonuclease VII small subunit